MSYTAMGSAIYGKLGTVQYTYPTNGTATTTGALGLYDTQAPQGSAPPYLIYQVQSTLDLYTFGSKSGESADYFVKVVSNRQDPTAQAFAIYDQMHSVLQDAALSLSGGYSFRCRRSSRRQYQDADKFWHVGGIYRIDTWSS
jgi:hypothetical protein